MDIIEIADELADMIDIKLEEYGKVIGRNDLDIIRDVIEEILENNEEL